MEVKNAAVGSAVWVALLFAAPAAGAQSAAQNGYAQPAGSVQQQLSSTHDDSHARAVATDSRGSSLPFTGLDIGLVGAASGVLLAIGFGIRRLSRAEPR
jgi:hypothetical protein